MPLAPGTNLGPYEILAPVGAGGMGEVYKARDTRLDRVVAVKVSNEQFSERFDREARAVAALNHSNICTLFDVGPNYLVMEYIEGSPLNGPLPLDLALKYAAQICDALDAAHRKGITHRDLKPANILVTKTGIKLLDFGLAKFGSANKPASQPEAATITMALTGKNEIVGTLYYMSPEQLQAQATGQEIDARSDIFSFGLVLYEMLTGKRAFEGKSPASVIAAIMERPAPSIAEIAPPALDRVLKKCLAKDPDERWQSARDLKDELQWVGSGAGFQPAAGLPPGAGPSTSRSSSAGWIAAAILAVAAAGLGFMHFRGANSSTPAPTRLSIVLPAGEQVTAAPAISRDGRLIAYAAGKTLATSQLYVRALDEFAAHPVANSAGAQYPFFSPDGKNIGFFAGGKLRRAAVNGGGATDLASAPAGFGAFWGNDDKIVYTPILIGGLWRVAAAGGMPEQLTKPDGGDTGYGHEHPQRLPGTNDFLFSVFGKSYYGAVYSPKTGTWRAVTPPTSNVPIAIWYAASGHLFANDRSGNIIAAPWTPDQSVPVRLSSVVIENVNWSLGRERAWLDVSETGTAVYAPGNPSRRHVVWVDRKGQTKTVPGDADQIIDVAVSRNGRRLSYGGQYALWVVDEATGARTRLLTDAAWAYPGAWLPGDEQVATTSNRTGDWEVYSISAQANAPMKLLLKKPYAQFVQAAGPDGSIVYQEYHPVTGYDLWTLYPDGHTTPLAATPFNESSASISADGRYVAYVSDESGRREVYAVSASGQGARTTVSFEGGTGPVWSRNGKELFYRAGDDLISVDVNTSGELKLGGRRKLLDFSAFDAGLFHEFDVSADGERFLVIRTDADARPTRLDVILNWFDELKRKVPGK